MNKSQVKLLIIESFDNVSYPSNITLHMAQAHDNMDYDNDEKYKKLEYIGKWQDIPSKHLLECQYSLPHLEPDGFRYYLPAFMIWTIDNYVTRKEWINETTLYSLCRSNKDHDLHLRNFVLFTNSQYIACARFLEYFLENDPEGVFINRISVQRTFDRYWIQYL